MQYLQSLRAAGDERLPLGRGGEAIRATHWEKLLAYHRPLAERDPAAGREILFWANALSPTIDTLVSLGVADIAGGQPPRALDDER